MTSEQRAEIEKHAKRMYDALQVVVDELGSFAACDTVDKRDEWINVIAAQSSCRRWFDHEYAKQRGRL